nr:unnamed protein product [Haemonchus contortus]
MVPSNASADFAKNSHNLAIVNTRFRKRDSHLITFYSGENRTQIDFVLVRHRDQGLVTDAKTVPYETVATQHRPLICTLKIAPPKPKLAERCGPARIKWWRLKEKEEAVVSSILLPAVTTVDETWTGAAEAITRVARSKLGVTKPGRRKLDKQTWLWTDHVRDKVHEKKKQYHAFLIEKTADNWQRYQIAKKEAKKAVVFQKAAHYADLNKKLESRDGERVMETKMLRWTAGVTRLDRISNDAIRERFGVASIVDKMREARLRWYGHTLRAKNDSVRKISLNLDVSGKRPRGRPKQRWLDTLHEDLKAVNIHPDQAFNREKWRQHIRKADPAYKRDKR